MSYQSINPNTGKTVKTFEHFSKAQLETSLAAAESCFMRGSIQATRSALPLWPRAQLLHAQFEDFAKLATLEMGKRIDEARGEVKFSANILAYYAEHAEKFLKPVKAAPEERPSAYGEQPLRRAVLRRAVEFSVLPVGARAGPQLMAGNVIVVETCRLCSAVCDRVREAVDRGRCTGRRLHQFVDFA